MHAKSGSRKLALMAIATCAVAGLAEGGLRAYLALREGLGSTAAVTEERLRFLAGLPVTEATPEDTKPAEEAEEPWFTQYELHPFFGFVFDRSLGYVNNQGFQTTHTYPYRCQRDEYVIGILGASVAMSVGGRSETMSELLLAELASRGYAKVTVLQLAIGGSKQPSAFNVLCTFLPDIDMAVYLDGLNEAVLPAQCASDYPVTYPISMVYAPLANPAASPYVNRDAALLALYSQQIADVTRRLEQSPLRFSMITHLVWRLRARHYNEAAAALRISIADLSSTGWSGIDPIDRDGVEATLSRYARWYEDLTEYSDTIARSRGKLFFHFIQPNQYVTGGKRLSREELARFVTRPVGAYDRYYEQLDAMSLRLRARGVASYSLSKVFAEIEETLYTDDCCHLNPRGIELLERAMVDRIIASQALASIPAAADRQLPDWRLEPPAPAGR